MIDAFSLKPTPIPWRRLWGTGLTTTTGLVVGLALGHLSWGIWAFMGGFASLYVHDQPYYTRGVILALVGLGLAGAMGLGALTQVWWHTALTLGFVAAAATYLTGAFDISLPAGFMFVLIACISAALPHHPPGIIWVRVLCVLGGSAIAWGVGMVDFLWDRPGPVVHVLSQAFHALAHYSQRLKSPSAQRSAALSVMAAHRAAAASLPRFEDAAAQTAQVFRALVALSTDRSTLSEPWSRLLHHMADTLREQPSQALHLPQDDEEKGAHNRRWRQVMEQTLKVVQGDKPTEDPLPLYRPSAGERLSRALSRKSLVRPAVARIGIAVTLSVVLARALGISHPFWVPLTCAAVLQGVSTAIIAQRTIQRVVGTTLGLMLAALLMATHPNSITTAILVVALQLGMLFFIAKNYGISVVFITALALVIIYSGTHPTVIPLMWARFKDTLVGSAVGLAAALTLWSRASSVRLSSALSAALEHTGRLVQKTLDQSPSASQERAQTLTALLSMQHLYQVATGEIPALSSEEVWPQLLAAERLGFLAIAWRDTVATHDPGLARALDRVFETFTQKVRGEPSRLQNIPTVPSYPAVEQQLWEVAEALDILGPEE